jgi:hypothetical protein
VKEFVDKRKMWERESEIMEKYLLIEIAVVLNKYYFC